ncbi:MAG TPA: glycosyltransferase family 87 protein [Candidatus Cybelea sp.]|nr:glycosyltransferase family 87 protein [Candidatus Cybelea sp.]
MVRVTFGSLRMMRPKHADAQSRHLNLKAFTRIAALLSFVLFLLTTFRAGWTRQETDFPNYYTAAVLVREGKPLRDFYDWTWFQREMNYAGIEHQLGGYAAQTPLTMLPMLPLSSAPVQRAKRIWLVCNLIFLAATIWLLSRLTHLRFEQIWLLTFCGFAALYTNFLFGQYYVFLLFLLTASSYLLDRSPRQLGSWTRNPLCSRAIAAGRSGCLHYIERPSRKIDLAERSAQSTRRWCSGRDAFLASQSA